MRPSVPAGVSPKPATNGEELFDYHFPNGDAVPQGQHAAFNDYRRQFGEGPVTPTDFYTWLKQRPAPSGNHQSAGRADGNFDLDAANDELFG